jgi:hypothetical protein
MSTATGTAVKQNKGMKRKEREGDSKFFEFVDGSSSPAHMDNLGGSSPSHQPCDVAPTTTTTTIAVQQGRGEVAEGAEMEMEMEATLAAIVRPPLLRMEVPPCLQLSPEEELRNIRAFVGTITNGIGQLQHTLQRSQTQWTHFNRIVGQLSQLSQELTGQVEQTASLYTLLVRTPSSHRTSSPLRPPATRLPISPPIYLFFDFLFLCIFLISSSLVTACSKITICWTI